jgi:exonuclease VII small subunit
VTNQAPEEKSFEDARAELRAIVERLAEDDVPMAEVMERSRRGKAIEVALGGYIEDTRGELDRIESGEDLPEITIRKSPPPDPKAETDEPNGRAASDEDIPF